MCKQEKRDKDTIRGLGGAGLWVWVFFLIYDPNYGGLNIRMCLKLCSYTIWPRRLSPEPAGRRTEPGTESFCQEATSR